MANSRKSSRVDLSRLVASLPASQGERVVLGLSGGLDSVVLLHILKDLSAKSGFSLSCVHVHHGISPNAGCWAKFCEDLCNSLDVPIYIEQVDISPYLSKGVEAAARSARYEVFGRVNADFLALAHHRDDQAETVLLQLFRGSGVKGLSAMGEATSFGAARLVRPLLRASREDLEQYAKTRQLRWVEDESNQDPRFDRNFLRREVLPLVADRYPSCRETLARASAHFCEASELMEELARIDANGAIEAGRLKMHALADLSPARAKNLMRHYLEQFGVRMPSAARLEEMLKQLRTARPDASIAIRHDGMEVRSYRGWVHVVPERENPGGLEVPILQPLPTGIPELSGVLHFEAAEGGLDPRMFPFVVRTRRGGERLRLHSDGPARSLKNLFQESAIPPWQRKRLPLLFRGDRLVWVPGIGMDPECRVKGVGILPVWKPFPAESETLLAEP